MSMRGRLIIMLLPAVLAAPALGAAVVDPNLRVQTWVRGLESPTGMAFIDNGARALVLEKNSGQVKVIANRAVAGVALDLPVANNSERGLLGIALSPTFDSDNFVFLSYTAAGSDGGSAIDNRVERYRWNGSTLEFDRRVLTMPASPGPNHNGGKIAFGPDKKLYAQVGDVNLNGLTANFENSNQLTNSAAILRVNPSGTNVSNNPFGNPRSKNSPLNKIYGYGVRNGFGLAFDPITGSLWDTENGPDRMDEINRITPGFNSGWEDVMGPSSRGGSIANLASLGPAAHYEEPKFSWDEPVAPTDAYFMETARLGREYAHDLFVGTVLGGGVIYRFELTHTRRALRLAGGLADGVADNSSGNLLAEQDDIVWGTGFGVVTDLVAGPGGMYVLSLSNNVMYRITTGGAGSMAEVVAVPEPPPLVLIAAGMTFILRRGTRKPLDLGRRARGG